MQFIQPSLCIGVKSWWTSFSAESHVQDESTLLGWPPSRWLVSLLVPSSYRPEKSPPPPRRVWFLVELAGCTRQAARDEIKVNSTAIDKRWGEDGYRKGKEQVMRSQRRPRWPRLEVGQLHSSKLRTEQERLGQSHLS